MPKGPQGQMTVPELLEARQKVASQLNELDYTGYLGTKGGDPKVSVRAELTTIMEEIQAELTEQGYKDA